MLNYQEPKVRKQLANVFLKIAKRVEEDEEFAKYIFSELEGEVLKPEPKKKKKAPKQKSKEELTIDIFYIFQVQGPEGLLNLLKSLELQELKKIVTENGLDPAQKVRKWRSREKMIDYIVESVRKQMSKGGAFLR